jgi:hypothetical protein
MRFPAAYLPRKHGSRLRPVDRQPRAGPRDEPNCIEIKVAMAGGFFQLAAFGRVAGASMRGTARSRCIGADTDLGRWHRLGSGGASTRRGFDRCRGNLDRPRLGVRTTDSKALKGALPLAVILS